MQGEGGVVPPEAISICIDDYVHRPLSTRMPMNKFCVKLVMLCIACAQRYTSICIQLCNWHPRSPTRLNGFIHDEHTRLALGF